MCKLRVFVSSTFLDLKPIRGQLMDAIRKAGDEALGMEDFGARPELPLSTCMAEVRKSDVTILILGQRYGAVEPTSGLSFTHLEFRQAVTHDIPVLAYVMRPDGAGLAGEESESLSAFRSEVYATCTVAEVSNAAEIPVMAMAGLRRFVKDRTGRTPQFQTFQPADVFFSSLIDGHAPFNHAHSLVGREAVIRELCSFLDSESQLVAVLPGHGGTGKSKLLLEMARSRADRSPTIVFLGMRVGLTSEKLRELPEGATCVVIDDAHRHDGFDDLVRVFAGASRTRSMKLLLSCRPSGLGLVKHALRGLRPEHIVYLPELTPLDSKSEAMILAKATLGAEYEHLAEQLVMASDGNPLVITVGARLVAQGKIAPALLAQVDDFQQQALDGLLTGLPPFLDGGVPSSRFLEVLAAVGPIQVGQGQFTQLAAAYFQIPASSVSRAIAHLQGQQALMRRGYHARIQPDVLADHLLFRAAVAGGQATGFITEMFRAFGTACLSNILTNASELEWRCKHSGSPVNVLGDVWTTIQQALPGMTHRARGDLLEALEGAAWFAPAPLWELITWVLQHPNAPEEQDELLRSLKIGPESAIRQIPGLLSRMAWHADYAPRCAELLWDLGQADEGPTNPFPEHPMRTLADLIKFERRRPLDLQLLAARGLENAFQRDRKNGKHPDVSVVLSEALSREPEFTEPMVDGIRIGHFPLNANNQGVQEIRRHVCDLLEAQARGDEPAVAMRAVNVLDNLLRPPYGMMGRQVDAEELASWVPEVQDCLRRLVAISRATQFPAVTFGILVQIRECNARAHWGEISPALDEAVTEIGWPERFDLYQALLPSWRDFFGVGDRSAAEAAQTKRAADVAKRLWTTMGDVATVLATVNGAAMDLRQAGIGHGVYSICHALCEQQAVRVRELAEELLRGPYEALHGEPSGVLRHWIAQDPDSALARLAAVIDEKDHDRALGIAGGYTGAWFGQAGKHCGANLANLRRLTTSPHRDVRMVAVHALHWAKGACEREALDILVSVDFRGDTELLDRALMTIGSMGLSSHLLQEADFRALLGQVGEITDLGDENYHIGEFLGLACRSCPQAVVRTMLDRVHHAASLADGAAKDFTPLPYVEFRHGLANLSQAQDYAVLLREIRDASQGTHWAYNFWIPRLFAMAANNFCETATEVLREWISSGDPDLVAGAAHLLREADHEFVFQRHDFVSEILTSARALGEECYRRACSELFASVISGVYSSSLREPSPRLVSERGRAEQFAIQYTDHAPAAEFYRNLSEYAASEIHRHQNDAEERLGE